MKCSADVTTLFLMISMASVCPHCNSDRSDTPEEDAGTARNTDTGSGTDTGTDTGSLPIEDTGNTDVVIDEDDCTAADRTICENEIDGHCGYTYEFWRDSGGGCMTVTSGGGFSIEWNDNNNVLARKGIRPGSENLVVTYEADYSAGGTSYMGIYGWTQNPLVEYYILDNWGDWRPPDGADVLDSIESDGGTYEIFRTRRVNAPSIEGSSSTFYQYWSVRTDPRSSGTITVGHHFDAWTSNGLDMGRLYEVSMVVEGYHSYGSADVNMSMTTR